MDYLIIIGMIVAVVGLIIVGLIVQKSLNKNASILGDVKVAIYCPICSTDVSKQIDEKLLGTTRNEVRIKCIICGVGSLWNTSGYPPVLIRAERNNNQDKEKEKASV